MIMDKRGWLHVVEAFLAVLIIIGVFFAQIKNIAPGPKQNVLIVEKSLLQEIARNTSFRNEIVMSDISTGPLILDSSSTSPMVKYLATRMPGGVNFTLMICAPADICSLGRKNVYAKDVFVSSTLTTFQPRKLKLFMWEV